MADSTAVRVVSEMQSLALPAFVFTIIIVTAVLLWGMRILQSVLMKQDPENPKLRFLDKALSEKHVGRATDPAPQGAPNPGDPPPSPPGSQVQADMPSTSRVVAAVGTLVLAAMLLGVGYYTLWSLFTYQSVDLSSIGTYFLAGSALFAPYAVNQLSSIFKAGG